MTSLRRGTLSRKPKEPEIRHGARVRVVGGPYDGSTGWFGGKMGTTGLVRVRLQLPDKGTISALVKAVELIEDEA